MQRPLAFHPFLLALFPTLLLYSENSHQFYPEVIALPLALTALSVLLAQSVLALGLSNWNKAALLLSFFLLMFFSYGHLARICQDVFGGFQRWYLLPVWTAILAGLIVVILRTRRELPALTTVLNYASAFLVVVQAAIISVALIGAAAGPDAPGEIPAKLEGGSRPNIYYIVLDGYGRADILEELYDFDNTAFIEALRQRGFYIASDSRANYIQTALSLASSLNSQYIPSLLPASRRQGKNRGPLIGLIRKNLLAQALKSLGYRTVAFASGYYATELEHFDVYLTPDWNLGEFAAGLIRTTPVPAVRDLLQGEASEYDLHRRRVLYALEHLPDTCSMRGPLLVFAHIICPHPPFVFDADGRPLNPAGTYEQTDGSHLVNKQKLSPEEYVKRYTGQLEFINRRLPQTLDALIENSPDEPVIILQADHGPGLMLTWKDPDRTYMKERLAIFSAFLLPGEAGKDLYPGISPVNTFRVILNQIFLADLELLEDRSFFSKWNHPYMFQEVTQQVTAGSRAGTTLHDVWGLSAGDVWITGAGGSVGHFDGKTWTRMNSGTTRTLHAVWAAAPRDVWAVGAKGTVLRYDGRSFSSMESHAREDLHAVWGSAPDDVWMAGAGGTVLRYDGKSLGRLDSATGADLHAAWGAADNDVWLVGASGTVLRFDGKSFARLESGSREDLHSVWGFSPTDVWMVGAAGTILHFDGKKIQPSDSGTRARLLDVWGAKPGALHVVGEEGTVLQFDGKSWSQSPAATGNHLRAVWGPAADDVWSVGEAGAMLHRR